MVPPPCSTSSRAARSAATGGSCGSTTRSKRRDASLGSLCRRAGPGDDSRVEVRRLQDDVDRSAFRHLADLGGRPAHDAGQADRTGVVDDEQVVGVQPALDAVEGDQGLVGPGPAHGDASGQPGGVVGVQRLAQLEHHVVRHVDDQRDRAHARREQPALQPPRAGRAGVHAVDAAGHEPRAGRVVQRHRPRVTVGDGHLDPGRGIDEVGVERACQLAGQPAHREAVAAIRGDGQLDHRIVEAQQHRGVLTGGRSTRREHQDAGVVGADAQLTRRGDHAVGDVPVGLARRDREPTGQHRAGQGDHDEVADGEVARTADDPARSLGSVRGAGVDPAPADRLLEPGQLLDLHDTGRPPAGPGGRSGRDRGGCPRPRGRPGRTPRRPRRRRWAGRRRGRPARRGEHARERS